MPPFNRPDGTPATKRPATGRLTSKVPFDERVEGGLCTAGAPARVKARLEDPAPAVKSA